MKHPSSLTDWMVITDLAGIDSISTRVVSTVLPGDIMEMMYDPDELDDHQENRVDLALSLAHAHKREDEILRWDVCAPSHVKHQMAVGHGPVDRPDNTGLNLDDPRAFDIIGSYNRDTPMPILARRWVRAEYVDGYPVEFRAYVSDGVVQGVSNYYPQRPLPEEYEIVAKEAWSFAIELTLYRDTFTADFLLREDDTLLFIEGGPGHGKDPNPFNPEGGAHPCCFAPGEVSGVALEPREGALDR